MGGVTPAVFIIGHEFAYASMFKSRGWRIVDRLKDADLLQFTGGADVTPSYYGERAHPRTYCSPNRDSYESVLFEVGLQRKLPMAGICRGGQFLNVKCGGRMWQDVDNHATGGLHDAHDFLTESTVKVSSTHHQMMRPALGADILMTARMATRKDCMIKGVQISHKCDEPDVEAVFYKEPGALCFQPHPEFMREDLEACRHVYFNYIENFFSLG